MNLPNHEKAYVPREKLINYLLSETHAIGKAKARFLRSMGYTLENSGQLSDALLKIAKGRPVLNEMTTPYGIKYVVDGEISGPNGMTVDLRTIWIIDQGDERPRFVTAYPI